MKRLRFYQSLSELILKGEKTTTWRLFDDKDLSVGDLLNLVVTETNEKFGTAEILEVKETTLGDLSEEDWEGHEKFSSEEEMYDTYSGYYNRKVDEHTPLKIIKFKLK